MSSCYRVPACLHQWVTLELVDQLTRSASVATRLVPSQLVTLQLVPWCLVEPVLVCLCLCACVMMFISTCACAACVCLCHDVKFNLCCFHIGLPSPLSTRILTGHLEARAPLALMQSRVVSQNKYPWKRPEPCCCCKNMTFWAIASAFITCNVYLTWSVDGRFVSPVSGWVSDW